MLSQLITYPLRVNDGGTISVETPAALASRIDEIFTPKVKSAILDQKLNDIFCHTSSGIMYGGGSVWASPWDNRFRVATVNVLPGRKATSQEAPRVYFVCESESIRARIQAEVEDEITLLVWTKPKSILEDADTTVVGGAANRHGTGPCAHTVWTFKSDGSEYSAFRGGCYADSNPPPEGSTGSMTIHPSDAVESHHWCF